MRELDRVWYIVGALLGGYPLAQGTIYLLMNRRFADISALVCSAFILVAAVCVLSSPIEIPAGFDHRLTGRVFAWQCCIGTLQDGEGVALCCTKVVSLSGSQ